MSISSELRLILTADLHARPAGQVAQAAARFRARITLRAGERSAEARSVLGVMALGAVAGSELLVTAEGEDALAAVRGIVRILEPLPTHEDPG
jgi:phosphocarrier protein HPr